MTFYCMFDTGYKRHHTMGEIVLKIETANPYLEKNQSRQ